MCYLACRSPVFTVSPPARTVPMPLVQRAKTHITVGLARGVKPAYTGQLVERINLPPSTEVAELPNRGEPPFTHKGGRRVGAYPGSPSQASPSSEPSPRLPDSSVQPGRWYQKPAAGAGGFVVARVSPPVVLPGIIHVHAAA